MARILVISHSLVQFLCLIDDSVCRGTCGRKMNKMTTIHLFSMMAYGMEKTVQKKYFIQIVYDEILYLVKRPESKWNCFKVNRKQLLLLFTIYFFCSNTGT